MPICSPGMPCYSDITPIPGTTCGIGNCHLPKSITDLIFYNGPDLPNTGIDTCDTLTTALEKIDDALSPRNIALSFFSALTDNSDLLDIFCEFVNGCIPSSACHCFTLHNTETDPGTLPYTYVYTDCSGMNISGLLAFGQSLNACLKPGSVFTNFAYTLTDNGDCSVNCTTTTTSTTSGG